MNDTEQCLVHARMADLTQAVAFVEAFCTAGGVGDADGLRLTLMVEELFTNTVEHGHGGDSDAAVRLMLRDRGTHIELFYEDHAPAFDPLGHVAELSVEAQDGPDTRRVGGLGIVLVCRMATQARYAFEDGCNRLWLSVQRSP